MILKKSFFDSMLNSIKLLKEIANGDSPLKYQPESFYQLDYIYIPYIYRIMLVFLFLTNIAFILIHVPLI